MDTTGLLIEANIDLATKMARKFSRGFPQAFDDILSEMLLALVEAANNWDSSKSAFRTYVFSRMNSRIMEYRRSKMRLAGWVRNHKNEQQWRQLVQWTNADDATALIPTSNKPVDEEYTLGELRKTFIQCADSFRDRAIAEAYLNDTPLKEIAKEFGICEGRINQIIAKLKRETKKIVARQA